LHNFLASGGESLIMRSSRRFVKFDAAETQEAAWRRAEARLVSNGFATTRVSLG
jgi:hypothetical protein